MRRLSPPLFGRSLELASLQSLVDRVADGAGQMAVVEGEAGIGKTRLLREVLTYADGRGFQILRGDADELERDRPFRAISDALDLDPQSEDPKRAEIGRLLVGESDHPSQNPTLGQAFDLSFRIIDAIATLVEELCTDTAVVLALEDLQWADPSTIRAVRSLARRLAPLPLAILVTFRPSPSSPELDRAVEDFLVRGAQHVVLRPLDDHAAVALGQAVLSADLGPKLREQVAGAGGSPLLVIEVLEALRQEGAIEFTERRAEVGELSVPPSLRLTILRRLSFLPEETLELLKVASILGASFSLADLAVVTRRSVVDLLPPLTDAMRAAVLGEAEERLAFRHDLIREAIYEELPAGIRKDLHREAGQALAEAGAPSIQVAEQMSLGASLGDAEAVNWLRRAAQEAASRSALIAVRLLERGLALTNRADPQRRALLGELAAPLLTIGRLADAEACLREALALEEDPAARLPLQRVLATIIFFRGDRPGARDLYESNARAPESPEGERSTDLGLAAVASMYVGELQRARALAEMARAAGERSGNVFGTSNALMTLCTVARVQGFVQEAVDLGTQAVDLASQTETPWAGLYVHPAFYLGGACLEGDRLDEAEQALRAGRDISERFGSWHIPWYQMYLGAKHFLAGDWDDAIAEAAAGLSVVEEMEFTPFAAVLFPEGLIAAIALHRGDMQGATAGLAKAEQELARSGPQVGFDAMLWAKPESTCATSTGR